MTSLGQEIGGELDPGETAVDGLGEGLGKEGLAYSGEVLDDDVAAGQQGHDAGADDLLLAEDDRRDGGRDLPGALGHLHHLLVLKDRRRDRTGVCRTAGRTLTGGRGRSAARSSRRRPEAPAQRPIPNVTPSVG